MQDKTKQACQGSGEVKLFSAAELLPDHSTICLVKKIEIKKRIMYKGNG